MMSKEQHINFWKTQADDDWDVVDALFKIHKYSQCLFWAHLVLEKYSKAIWIRDNESNVPPKTHNLNHLLSQTRVVLKDEEKEFLLLINKFQIEGRYPDYITQISGLCNKEFTEKNLTKIKIFKKWIGEQMQ